MTSVSSEIDGLNSLDPQVITAIHNRYYPDIYRFARFRVTDEVIAEDIVGEVFTRLLEAAHRGRGPTTNLRGWLFKTTSNIVNDHFRKIYNLPVEDPCELDENSQNPFLSQVDPVVIIEESEQKGIILCAMEKLTDAQKLVITLRFANKFSLEETAILMGKNPNSIKALQCRALMNLRKNLGNG
jgi:RNA polymerase sigma-70 factor (ECF subfamily)